LFYTDVWGLQPGVQPPAETYESAFRWGPAGLGLIIGGTISSLCTDPGNTPTYELRVGLLLGQRTADGTYTNYLAGNTDGSEVAAGVLLTAIRLQNILTGAPQPRFYGLLVSGPVKAAAIIGLDYQARQQMADRFTFDDVFNIPGLHYFPWRRFESITANYTVVVPQDNAAQFDNTGATGPVTLTLPPIQNGITIGLRVVANQNFAITSNEGGNIVAFNNASANTLTFSTAGQLIGGGLTLFSNPGATKWIAQNDSAGANTITVS
jgi:hypothetical protein